MSAAAKKSRKMIQIKQVRSGIGCPRYMRETLQVPSASERCTGSRRASTRRKRAA